MCRAKRARVYVPKAKGCYECSQRRISCDRRHPSCEKCVAKGLECSGIAGQRPRFRNVSSIAWEAKTYKDKNEGDRSYSGILDSSRPQENDTGKLNSNSFIGPDTTTTNCAQSSPVGRALNQIPSWQRILLKHFSDYIAPQMVIIDDRNNGWRNIVLPLACADEMVMCAVLAVSAFHSSTRLASHQEQEVVDPLMLYSKTTRELQRRQLDNRDPHARDRIILTIVLLLLYSMVNGGSEFQILLRMLHSALEVVGSLGALAESGRTIANFSAKQIHKMHVYASALVDEQEGMREIASQVQKRCWDEQELTLLPHPDYGYTLPLISELRQLAFQIYLDEVTRSDDMVDVAPNLLGRFRLALESLPETAEGQHVLVWPAFIAAAASRTAENRDYFTRFLQRQFLQSGFVNIRKAFDCLKRVWERKTQESWTRLICNQGVFVM
ncbi:hypothetical protein M426DRAFT_225434 [Hypoxylon sp. CI-4A]|nr:hypothetical protein M426DRAFT_225434 [Hypoxylon sp. CI-4A]